MSRARPASGALWRRKRCVRQGWRQRHTPWTHGTAQSVSALVSVTARATHKRPSCTRMLQLHPFSLAGRTALRLRQPFGPACNTPSPKSSHLLGFLLCSQRHTATGLSKARTSTLPSPGFARCGCIAGAWRFAVFVCPQPSLRLYSKPKPQFSSGLSLSRTAPCSAFLFHPLSCLNALSGFQFCACRSFNQRCVLPVSVGRRPR
jgi:hypothetical protein